MDDGPAAVVEDAERAHQALQAAFVPGGRHDRVRADPVPAGQDDLALLEALHRGHDLHRPLAHGVDQTDVLHRHRPLPHPGVEPGVGEREAVGRQVRHRDLRLHPAQPVDEADRQPAHQDPRVLGGPARGRAAHDVRGSADRQPHPRGAPLHQVHGDLGPRVADAHDEHVAAGEGPGVAVLRRVQELAVVRVAAGPVREARRVVVARGDDDRGAGQLTAAGGVQQPAGAVGGALDPRHLDAGDDLQAVVLGVLLQVPDHVVTGHPPSEPARHRQTGQRGHPAGGVQAQPVVVAPPGTAHPVGPFQDDGPYPPGAQGVRDGESARAAADHVDGAVRPVRLGGPRGRGRGGVGGAGGVDHERERNHAHG